MAKREIKLPKLPKGEGSMFVKNDKIYYQKMINGKRTSVMGKTVKEVISLMKEKEEIQKEIQNLSNDEKEDGVTLERAMYLWLITFKKPMLKPKSFDTIESTYLNYIKDTKIGVKYIEDITVFDLQNYITRIASHKSNSTARKVHNLLNQYYKNYYLTSPYHNPMIQVNIPKEQGIKKHRNEKVLNDLEIKRLESELMKPYINGVSGFKNGKMILFILWTFTRLGEVLALQWKDIDFENKSISISKAFSKIAIRDKNSERTGDWEWCLDTTKTKSSTRIIPMSDKTYNLLLAIKNESSNKKPNDYIFRTAYKNPPSPQQLNNNLKKALNYASIKTEISIHGLRHTGISYYIRHGMDISLISKLAGHSDITVTDRIYYDIIDEQISHAFDTLE